MASSHVAAAAYTVLSLEASVSNAASNAARGLIGHLLLIAALWVSALPLAIAGAPGLTARLPSHSHATLRGIVSQHVHEPRDATSGGRCVAEPAPHTAPIACGADNVAASGVALPGVSPASIVPSRALLATRLVEPIRQRDPEIATATPPPRG